MLYVFQRTEKNGAAFNKIIWRKKDGVNAICKFMSKVLAVCWEDRLHEEEGAMRTKSHGGYKIDIYKKAATGQNQQKLQCK